MGPIGPDILQRAKELILAVDRHAVRRLILFGSRARGDAHPDSDDDILVLVSGLAHPAWMEGIVIDSDATTHEA